MSLRGSNIYSWWSGIFGYFCPPISHSLGYQDISFEYPILLMDLGIIGIWVFTLVKIPKSSLSKVLLELSVLFRTPCRPEQILLQTVPSPGSVYIEMSEMACNQQSTQDLPCLPFCSWFISSTLKRCVPHQWILHCFPFCSWFITKILQRCVPHQRISQTTHTHTHTHTRARTHTHTHTKL